MDTNQAYELLKYAASKNQQGYITPDEFNNILMPQAQSSYTDYLLGEYQKYQIKRPIAVVEFGMNERIRMSISPLIYGAILPINTQGVAPVPNDLEYPDAMWGIYGSYNIKFIQQDRQDSYLHSVIDPIQQNPVYLINHEGFQFYPERPYGQNQAKLSYVRTPPPIFWAYTLDTHGRPVYDTINSQQPVWASTDMLEVLVRALALIGVNLNSATLMQYSEQIKNGGQ